MLKYETIVMLSQSGPGALGLALRKSLPMLLGACGRNVVFGQNVVLRHPTRSASATTSSSTTTA